MMIESHPRLPRGEGILRFGISAAVLCMVCSLTAVGQIEIQLDGQSEGSIFEGLGALSAGASSRLLLDYPEAQRAAILDYLFKPNFGASLHHLKIEIGGDMNSTDGTEPSHARTRAEFEKPRPEYFERGYEWMLMHEARKRNPAIYLDALQWGAPGWIGQGTDDRSKFFSQDNADFIVSFIKGARQYHGMGIQYCGIWNETPHDVEWIKLLRRTLNQAGLSQVQVVAADAIGDRWKIARDMLADPELLAAVQVVGNHYPKLQSSKEARQTGKPLWSNEDGPWRGDWEGARALARMFNRNYVRGRMTKTIIWSLVTSYYDTLPIPNSGPMMAKEPWSGHYELQPALWVIAHTTQFAQPGWKYLDSGCALLKDGGSVATLRAPRDSGDYSVVIETMDAKKPQTLLLRVTGGLPVKPLHLWRTNRQNQFERLDDLRPKDDAFTILAEPESVYSLTTTTGQKKGEAPNPPAAPFPLPYSDDFEPYAAGKYAKYFSDQGGVFEAANRPDGKGQCLRQTIAWKNIDWLGHPTPLPYTLIGSRDWRNYEVSCDAWIEKAGSVSIWGRVGASLETADPAKGYWLNINADGAWTLSAFRRTLALGNVEFAADQWHRVALRFIGARITVLVNDAEIATITDWSHRMGQAGLGSGWNHAMFDNFSVRPLSGPEPPEPINLAKGAKATASSTWGDGYAASLACDGNVETRWNAAPRDLTNAWLELDFGKPLRFSMVTVMQFEQRIAKCKLQYLADGQWRDAAAAELKREDDWTATFPAVESNKLRLQVVAVHGKDPQNSTPSIFDIEVFNVPGSSNE